MLLSRLPGGFGSLDSLLSTCGFALAKDVVFSASLHRAWRAMG